MKSEDKHGGSRFEDLLTVEVGRVASEVIAGDMLGRLWYGLFIVSEPQPSEDTVLALLLNSDGSSVLYTEVVQDRDELRLQQSLIVLITSQERSLLSKRKS